jgi:transposase
VVAQTLVPKEPGHRVKTDRREALKLARSHRSGDLTAVWVPDEGSEALRDLVRQRPTIRPEPRFNPRTSAHSTSAARVR